MTFTMLNVEELMRAYVVANTPSYLFRHFRQEASLLDFAKAHTVPQLIQYASLVAADPHRDLESVAKAYAAVVALTFHELDSVREAIAGTQLDGLEWAGPILLTWLGKTPNLSSLSVTFSPMTTTTAPKPTGSDANNRIVDTRFIHAGN